MIDGDVTSGLDIGVMRLRVMSCAVDLMAIDKLPPRVLHVLHNAPGRVLAVPVLAAVREIGEDAVIALIEEAFRSLLPGWVPLKASDRSRNRRNLASFGSESLYAKASHPPIRRKRRH